MKIILQDIQKLERLLSLKSKVVDDTFVGRSLLPSEIQLRARIEKLKAKYDRLEAELAIRQAEEIRLSNVDFSILGKYKVKMKEQSVTSDKSGNGVVENGFKKPEPPGFMVRFRLSTAYNAIQKQENEISKVNVGRIFGPQCKFKVEPEKARKYSKHFMSPELELPPIPRTPLGNRNEKRQQNPHPSLPLIPQAGVNSICKECSFYLARMSDISLDRGSTLPTLSMVSSDSEDETQSNNNSDKNIDHISPGPTENSKVVPQITTKPSEDPVDAIEADIDQSQASCRYLYKLRNCSSLNDPTVLLRPPFNHSGHGKVRDLYFQIKYQVDIQNYK